MKRVFNTFAVLILCLTMVFSSVTVAFAADIGKPSGVKVTAITATSVSIKWNKVENVDGYEVYKRQSADAEWERIKRITNSSTVTYSDGDAEPGTVNYYSVRAFVKANWLGTKRNYSEYSKTVKAITKPNKVSGVKTTSTGANKITLAWNSASGAKAYQVWQLNAETGKYVRLANTSKNKYTVKNLQPLSEYSFKIRAYHKLNGVVYGEFSPVFTVSTKPADVKNFKLAKSSSTSYTLSWSADANVAGFQLGKYDKEAQEWKVVLNETTETSYVVSDINGDTGASDRYKIRAYILDGTKKVYGNWTEEIVGGTIPKAPKNLKLAANTDNGISITWDYSDHAAGYEVYSREKNGNWESVGTTHNNHFSHANLTEKKTYEYKVRAYIGAADSKIYGNFGEIVELFYEPIEIPETVYPDDWDKTGIIGYLYDPEEQCFYTADDPWQRNFGYNEIYDQSASLVAIIIETCRLKFEYDDRDWMIQLWKGNYGFVLYGAEIGIYNKPKDRELEHYDCATDKDMLQMEMTLYEKTEILGVETWVKTFSRPYERQWWHTGFVWGNVMTRFDTDLRMYARITMRDYAMLASCEGAFREQGFIKADMSNLLEVVKAEGNFYTTNGLDISFFWT